MSTDLRINRALTMETSQEAIQDQGEDNLAITAVSDVLAFSRLFDVYFPRLYKYILFRVYDAQLADDLVSDVFERILNQLPRFIPGKAPFSAWVFGIDCPSCGDRHPAQAIQAALAFIGVFIRAQ